MNTTSTSRDVTIPLPESAPGTWRELSVGYEEALSRVPEALKKEGFGIVTQMDLQEIFRAKLGVDFGRYRIFGACNPAFAREAVERDPRVGVLLPCNVVLYERSDGRVVAGAVDPIRTLGEGFAASGLDDVAREVGGRLERVLAALAA